ncbi:MAG: type I secretion system permease/ATPase [Rhodobacteraceae bacterium]|nr:type I secretion system permease/ATPase [Paracoccaceae bacterium]
MKAADIRARNPYRKAMHTLRRTLVVVGLFSAAANILMLTGPIYMLQVYDRVLSSGSVATLQGLFAIVTLLYLFLGIYEFLRVRLLSRASYRLDALVGDEAFGYRLRPSFQRKPNSFNPVRDLEIVRGFMSSQAIQGLFDLPWIPLFLVIVFLIHPWLGYLTVAGAAVVIAAALLNQALTRRYTGEAMAADAAERLFVDQIRRNSEAVLALGMRQKLTRCWREMHGASLARGQGGGDLSEMFSAFSRAFRLFLQSALLTVGAFLALRQEISPGMIVASSIIAGRALAPVDKVIGQWPGIARAREAHKRLLMAMDILPPAAPKVGLPAPTGAIQVTNVIKLAPGGAPAAERKRVLDRINFTLEPGDGLCVMGNSAAGKSSLTRILVGAWKPDMGEVRIDGATLDQWDSDVLGRHIGYLPQSFEMLPGNIAQNIARFDPQAKDAQVIEAAKIAGVHDMILALPDGYSSRIGDPTQPLSGGQIQRIGLARALFGYPRIVVLDEPNSNLDTKGNNALGEAIEMMRSRGSTVIVTTHQPTPLKAINKVLLLSRGAMAHFGDREEVFRMAMRSAPTATLTPTLKSG